MNLGECSDPEPPPPPGEEEEVLVPTQPSTVRLFMSGLGGPDPSLLPLETFASDAPEFDMMADMAGPGPMMEDLMIGADLRDMSNGFAPVSSAGVSLITVLRKFTVFMATRTLNWFRTNVTRGAVAAWGSLPDWMKAAIGAAGITTGINILFNGDEEVGGELALMGDHSPHLIDGHLGAHIVGSWIANGITFYRLSDGKLAVQNKKGRWKVWRPKRPVVLMPGGASSLKTLLKADSIVTKQARQLDKMLRRRVPRAKKQAASPALPAHGHQTVSLNP